MIIQKKTRAMSLLITLAFIVIITILVVGFAETVRLSRPAAASFLERTRADQFARAGVERVIGTLNQQTADNNRNWISQPGQLVVGSDADNSGTAIDERKVLSVIVPLHSGSASSAAPSGNVLAQPNINIATYRDPAAHLLSEATNSTGKAIEMKVAWIYVRQSGALDTNASPALSASDPVVGRYAYWTDDESGKVNYNIAWGRTGNTNAPGHPSQIELSRLKNFSQSYADLLHGYITNVGAANPYNFFNTPQDARRTEKIAGGAGLAAALRENKFDVTHFNSDPNTTFFNEQRIVLTTRPERAGWTTNAAGVWVGVNGKDWASGGLPKYLRILKNSETNDPGGSYTTAIDAARLSETIATMALRPASSGTAAAYLQRGDWPMVSGTGSFQSKYYGSYPTTMSASGISAQTSRLAQLAVNVIDYVRAKESAIPMIQPIVGSFDSSQTDPAKTFVLNQNGSSTNGYVGLSRGPRVTELGVWYGTNSGTGTIIPPSGGANASKPIPPGSPYYLFQIEVFLPPNYGLANFDLSTVYLGLQGVSSNATKWSPNYSPASLPDRNADVHRIDASEVSGGTSILTAGNYAVISRAVLSTNAPAFVPPASTGVGTRVLLMGGVLNTIYQIAPANDGLTNGLPVQTGALSAMKSLEVDDPRLNQHPGDWVEVPVNSFGGRNSRWSAGKPAPAVVPEVDTDNALVSDVSLYMPPPRGTIFTRPDGSLDDNTSGQVMSVGELGFVHTGYEPCSKFGSTAIPPGVPWRTLRLQPSQSGTDVVPDWALLDLFTAPIAAPNQQNRFVYAPHDTSFGGRINLNSQAVPFGVERLLPIASVLQNSAYNMTNHGGKLSAAEAATIAENIVDRTLAAGGKQYGWPSGYDSPGELVEILGVADKGESSEELFRRTANLFTARGNVYGVYSIGQALKQSPSGVLTVLAEQRLQGVIERYTDSAGVTHFSPVYLRNLSP
jgi:hypothetical protein